MSGDKSLEERLTDAIFGNGREGLLARVTRIDSQTSDTNDKVTRIDGQVAELLQYRAEAIERRTLVDRMEKHLLNHPTGRPSRKTVMAALGFLLTFVSAISVLVQTVFQPR